MSDEAQRVAERLAWLREHAVLESDAEARERLARERPADATPFEVQVSLRLRELRALVELTAHLHRGER